MKKQLKLRLIESNDKPQIGDITISKDNILGIVTQEYLDDENRSSYYEDKVIKPISISDSKIEVGDIVTDGIDLAKIIQMNAISYTISELDGSNPLIKDLFLINNLDKVELLPEQLNDSIKQLIVNDELKDGDLVEVEYEEINYSKVCNHSQYNIVKQGLRNYCIECDNYMDSIYKEQIKLDSNNKAIITLIKESNLGLFEPTRMEFKDTLSNFKEVCMFDKMEIEDSDYISKWEDVQPDKLSNKIMYSEEEVKELCEQAAIYGMDNSTTHHYDEYDSDREFTDDYDFEGWFNLNKKK